MYFNWFLVTVFTRGIFLYLQFISCTFCSDATFCKSKDMYILQLKFYLKSDSAVYFLKNILNKAWLIFGFTLFQANS